MSRTEFEFRLNLGWLKLIYPGWIDSDAEIYRCQNETQQYRQSMQ